MSAKIDGRRRPWIAVSVNVAHSTTGTRLQEELGPAALAAWIGLLAACKRSPIEGRISFTSESEAWQIIGILEPKRLGFTLEEFLDVLGRLKQTRRTGNNTPRTRNKTERTPRGRVTNVQVTHWEQWQRPRSEPRNANEKQTKSERDAPPDQDQDQDHDIDPDPDQRGLGFAIQDARNDPEVRNADKVGRHRFREDPAKYNAMADKESAFLRMKACPDCDSNGHAWVTSDGQIATRDTPDTHAEPCSHPGTSGNLPEVPHKAVVPIAS